MTYDVRPFAFWEAMRQRLASARMIEILGKPGRIYRPLMDIPQREGENSKEWVRIIIMPIKTLWPVLDEPNCPRMVPFLIKIEAAAPTKLDDVQIRMDAAHAEAFDLLNAWSPGIVGTGAQRVFVAMPVWRYSPPDPSPLRDDDNDALVMSAEYRVELARVAA